MATTSPEALTEAFRTIESRRAAAVAAAVARYFRRRVNADDPATVERWLAAVVPLILREHSASAARAALFGNTLRTLETGDLLDGFRFEPVTIADLEERVRTSLVVTGPVMVRKRTAERLAPLDGPAGGLTISPAEERAILDQLQQQSAAGAGAAAARHVQNGGRSTLQDGATRDPRALGFVRVTRDGCCYFCAMLASRGAVYKGDSFDDSDPRFIGAGEVKVHDSCGCSVKPIYRRQDFYLDRSKEFSDLWASSTEGKSGREMIRSFRRAYENR